MVSLKLSWRYNVLVTSMLLAPTLAQLPVMAAAMTYFGGAGAMAVENTMDVS